MHETTFRTFFLAAGQSCFLLCIGWVPGLAQLSWLPALVLIGQLVTLFGSYYWLTEGHAPEKQITDDDQLLLGVTSVVLAFAPPLLVYLMRAMPIEGRIGLLVMSAVNIALTGLVMRWSGAISTFEQKVLPALEASWQETRRQNQLRQARADVDEFYQANLEYLKADFPEPIYRQMLNDRLPDNLQELLIALEAKHLLEELHRVAQSARRLELELRRHEQANRPLPMKDRRPELESELAQLEAERQRLLGSGLPEVVLTDELLELQTRERSLRKELANCPTPTPTS